MAVPSDPTVESIILEGMKAGGQYTVTNTDARYTEFLAYHWETLKTEIWNACRTDKFLEVQTCLIANVGYSPVTLPTDFDSEISLWVYDADELYRGTAQTGTTTSITLASTFSANADDMLGRYIFTLSGTGSGQHQQVINYDDGTKIATIGASWTAPDNTTTYLVAQNRFELKRDDYNKREFPSRRPCLYSRRGPSLLVMPAPDQVYPLILTYRSNLTRLDDTGTVFTKHLRERRHLWVEGVKTKTMSRYDDERYAQSQKPIWEQFLRQYAAQNVVYARMGVNR